MKRPHFHLDTLCIFVLLVAFCVGVAVGLAAGLAHMFRQRREIGRLQRETHTQIAAAAPGVAHPPAAEG